MHARLLICLIAFALAIIAAPSPASAFSMDDILSAPYASQLSSSPDGTALVWTVHLRGERNLYINQSGATSKLTTYDQDDGQELYDPQFLFDNSGVVYMRGAAEDNGAADNPNPLSLVAAPERQIYVVAARGGKPQLIGTGLSPAVSPKNNTVAWIKSGALQVTTLKPDGNGYKIGTIVAPSDRGVITQAQWSPDGSHLAIVNNRGDHAFVEIYTPEEQRLVYATPDFSNDGNPAWSADSSRVAFIRQPGAREDDSPYSVRTREPWSIWVADARTGNAHEAWHAHRGMGAAFYPVDGAAQLWWLAGDRIAFPWEGSGWRNLYDVNASGGAASALTPGAFEVEMVSGALDGSALYYATNENDIDHRHIWQVAVGSAPTAVSTGPHNQWRPAATAHGVAFVDAGYNTPPTVMRSEGHQISALPGQVVSPSFPAAEVVEPQLVTFRAPDGLLIHAQLFVPKDGLAKHAGIIFTHGGSQRQMLPGFHYMEAYSNLYEFNQYYANHGFVVLSINYRSGIMYGHDFREAKHYGWEGASEYQDLVAGAHYLMQRPAVDPHRIGLYGLSYGGYLTAMGLARNSDIFKAGADFAGVHNWATIFDSNGIQVGTREQRRIALQASPEGSLDSWHSPVFLAQGDDDRNVPFAQGVDLAARLRDRGIEVQTMVFPNETHENLVYAHMESLFSAAAAFLSEHLQKK
ncbi:MAG: prolyl oligopeptidase family serine peptidase [Candidatus Eremiobacteraeota bacterium]|nr:prolyl oligopeptidase family serine peptidase [Candidatus Eremiobacteraeota bacterium]